MILVNFWPIQNMPQLFYMIPCFVYFFNTSTKYFYEFMNYEDFCFESLLLGTTRGSCNFVILCLKNYVSPRGSLTRNQNTLLVCLILRMFPAHHSVFHFTVLTAPDYLKLFGRHRTEFLSSYSPGTDIILSSVQIWQNVFFTILSVFPSS
jgi:hypothetical protein